jgi:hypothetical protein
LVVARRWQKLSWIPARLVMTPTMELWAPAREEFETKGGYIGFFW